MPWPVVVLVSFLPVVTLGFGVALAHVLRDAAAADVPDGVSIPVLDDDAETVAAVTSDAVAVPVPEVTAETLTRRARRRPVDHTRKAERQ